jgi:hypothetical protein
MGDVKGMKILTYVLFGLAGIGTGLGCLAGWGVSNWFDISKFWSMTIGGILGAPVGFYSLVLLTQLISLFRSSQPLDSVFPEDSPTPKKEVNDQEIPSDFVD